METKDQKKHRKKNSGPKAEKEKELGDKDSRKRNPKAFAVDTFYSILKVGGLLFPFLFFFLMNRTLDLKTKKAPTNSGSGDGASEVGKSTLMQCLIRNFTRQKLTEIRGPVTIVSGKKRRLAITECGCDINMMVDLAKAADLVMMLIDASFGFEMETFEFLNICQVHGFPKSMGVLTHLNSFKHNKQLKKTKK
uniref:Bms1-type G domain-containing protein n=1 Tax=Rhinopithecus bieti TaxID=61621 RepID=A0A2K6LI75_RHIBE